MTTPLDEHIICREKVCVVCYRKARRKINDREVRPVQDFSIEGYRNDDLDFLPSICDGCHLLLEKKNIKEDTVLPQVDSYDPERPTFLRNSKCLCKICAVAKSTINTSPSKKKKADCPKTKTTPDNASCLVVCSKCFSRIGKGYSHNCTRCRKVPMGPKPLSSVGKYPNTTKKGSSQLMMSVIQRDLSLSNKKLKILAKDLRKSSGSRNLIEQGIMEAIYEKNRQLSEFFEVKMCTFTTVNEKLKSQENFEQKGVLCSP